MRALIALVLCTASCSTARPSSTPAPSVCVLPPRESARPGDPDTTNLAGDPLAVCSVHPMTGVHRDGRCATGRDDRGVHVVCAQVTDAFLRYTRERGNDLVTPAGDFPGLRPGDRWCLCAARWAEAAADGAGPPVVLDATAAAALRTVSRATLMTHALPAAPRK